MRDDVFDVVSVANNHEVEAPTLVDTGLPEALAFVVLLGVQRRVMEVVHQEAQLFVKGSAYRHRSILERFHDLLR
jgi:hypothetical protein